MEVSVSGYGYGLLAVTVGKAWRATAGLCHAFLVCLVPYRRLS